MTEPLHELMEKIDSQNKTLHNLVVLLQFKYQQEEAAKTPKYWRPTTLVMQGGQPDSTQLLPYNEQRDSFAIFNAGPGAMLLSDIHIDPGGLATAFGTPSAPGPMQGGAIRLWYLAANTQSSTVSTKGPLWGYCLGTGAFPANISYLTILETSYEAKVPHNQQLMSNNGEAHRLMHDYDANNHKGPSPLR